MVKPRWQDNLRSPLSPEQAYAKYREYQAKWDEAGIPWNHKGSPHKLLLTAKWYLSHVPFDMIVNRTLREHMPQMLDNIVQHNALLRRLVEHGLVSRVPA